MQYRAAGFTLIELMIVVVIVGILATIALPSYREQVRRGARADAKSVLLQNAQFMERNFTEANRYDLDAGGTAVALPFMQSPQEGGAKYTMTLVANATTFTLTATPVGGGSMAGDPCGAFTFNNLGQKNVVGASLDRDICWN